MKGESQTESIQIEMKKDEVKEFDSDECKEFTWICNHHRGQNVLIITIIIMMMTLTETFREPLRLVIMLNRHRACVQEDQDDNLWIRSITIILHDGDSDDNDDNYQPEPPLLFAHSPNPEFELLQC